MTQIFSTKLLILFFIKIDIYNLMKILITGAVGFIGYNFSKYLLDKTNYNIIGIDNINDYYSVKIKKKRLEVLKRYKNFSFHKIDIKNKQDLKKFLIRK